jgi:error-prone DNA polymerase
MGYYPPRVLVADARRSGVGILPLDINESSDHFIAEGNAIRISFKQMKGMSAEAVESILSARAEANFTSLRDFVMRTNVSQPILESLVRVGAFDSFGSRHELLRQLPGLLNLRNRIGRGTRPLFEEAKTEIRPTEDDFHCNSRARMLVERELLSLDLSAHPLDFYRFEDGITRMKDLQSAITGKTIRIVGSVIRYQTPPTRNGNRVVYIIMEDGTGIADVTVFSDVQEKCGHVLFRECWLKVTGKIQRRGKKALSIIAEDLSPLN